ncbi:O-methyltransferase ZRP4-like isoform X3 [Oryza glaberrima]|uniref:acetylserotonin O-methyltransferase n=2 Tax=Oryza TaxID=4527 RepID=A0A0D3HU33_9ORYZ|nr:O-methyltransferase ZRP4-like isoform X3 [Oryza glaberrima]
MASIQSNERGAGLLDAQLDLYVNTLAVIKSVALKAAMDLGIADAIHHHGGAATLPQIVTRVTSLHPSKIPCLRRLMRVLTLTGVFAVEKPAPVAATDEPPVYALTPASRLLLVGSGNHHQQAPIMSFLLHPSFIAPFLRISDWLQRELPGPCIFEHTHGRSMWEMADDDAAFNKVVNDAMVSDSRLVMDVVVREHGEVFRGISSLVDVAGGHGTAARAIAEAFPEVRCTVLDLPHVVAGAPVGAGPGVEYVAGDMFESVPPANAVFLKWIMHDWGDDECVKILKNCKKAIPSRDAGGKVIIVDMVVGVGPPDQKRLEMQTMFDAYMMLINGVERDEQEWKKVFVEAGFSDYKIMPVLGSRSIIEVYP